MDASAEKIYFTDVSNYCLRVIDLTSGIITTIAGNGSIVNGGTGEEVGDGGPAINAPLSTHAMRVTIAGDGHLFVTDAHQNRVRRIDSATGIITTIAGDGDKAFSGDGGPAVEASLAVPHGCRHDAAGNLFIADTLNHRIRRVDTASGIITTVAGTGEEGFSGDNVPAVEAMLDNPLAVDVAHNGDLYIVDTDNLRYRRVDAVTGLIHTIAGCGELGSTEEGVPAIEAKFGRPRDIRVSGNQVYLVDGINSTVFRVDLKSGLLHRAAGTGSDGFSGDGGLATDAELNHCYSMAVDPDGNVYIKDSFNNRIRRVEAQTGIIDTVAGNGKRGYTGDGGPASAATMAIG